MAEYTSKNIKKQYNKAKVKVGPGRGNTNQPVLDANGTKERKRCK